VSDHPRLSDLDTAQNFADRHIGPGRDDRARMLATLGFDSLDELMGAAVPGGIRSSDELDLPAPATEWRAPASCVRSPRSTSRASR